jgi:hypothetical protein
MTTKPRVRKFRTHRDLSLLEGAQEWHEDEAASARRLGARHRAPLGRKRRTLGPATRPTSRPATRRPATRSGPRG